MDGVSLLGWKWYAIIWGGSGKPFIGCVARELYGKRLGPVSSSDLTRGRRPFAQFRKVVIYRNDYYHRNWVVNGRMACSSRMFVSVRILAQEMIGKAIITCKLSVLFVSWHYKVVCFLAYIEPFSSIMRIAQHSKHPTSDKCLFMGKAFAWYNIPISSFGSVWCQNLDHWLGLATNGFWIDVKLRNVNAVRFITLLFLNQMVKLKPNVRVLSLRCMGNFIRRKLIVVLVG